MGQTYYHFTQQRTISFGEAVKSFYANYFDFKSRSRRSEYWWAMLYEQIAFFLVFSLSAFMFFVLKEHAISILLLIGFFLFLIFIPDLAVTVRRLHDVEKTGWLVLICLIPLGSIILIGFLLKDSSKRENQWGISPKYLQSETFTDTNSDNDLSVWSYMWPFLLSYVSMILFYFSLGASFAYTISSLTYKGLENDFNEEFGNAFESDSTLMIDEMDSTAILTDSTNFEVLSDSSDLQELPNITQAAPSK
jgi:uncharacterized membrane protein YhaH (DUF805 family)